MQIKTEGDKYDKNFGKKYQRFRQRVTVRLERGADIDAACGQLRGKIN